MAAEAKSIVVRRKLRADVTFRRHAGMSKGGEAKVPASVRDHLGVGDGDRVIFEDGCEETVSRASARGLPFVILWRAARPGEVVAAPAGDTVVKAEARPPDAVDAEPAPAPAAPLDSFADFVRSRRGRAG